MDKIGWKIVLCQMCLVPQGQVKLGEIRTLNGSIKLILHFRSTVYQIEGTVIKMKVTGQFS